MAKSRFGGEMYKPKQLGPEPAVPVVPTAASESSAAFLPSGAPSPDPAVPPSLPAQRSGLRTRILSDKVPFSSRIEPTAQENLARLVERTGRPVTHLLEEALADLFAKHKKELS
jgi:hypothetical protein